MENQEIRTKENNTNELKERHGCVTTWLALIIVFNFIAVFLYTVARDLFDDISTLMLTLLAIAGVGNIIFAIQLYKWKKMGFYGILIVGLITFAINISTGLGLLQSFYGLVGIGALFAVLQIKKNDVSAWENLE